MYAYSYDTCPDDRGSYDRSSDDTRPDDRSTDDTSPDDRSSYDTRSNPTTNVCSHTTKFDAYICTHVNSSSNFYTDDTRPADHPYDTRSYDPQTPL